MGKLQRRLWLLGLAVLVLPAVLVPLSRTDPHAGGLLLLVLAAGLSYLSGSHFVMKARLLRGEAQPPGGGSRPPRSGWGRSALYVTPIGAAAVLALSLLMFPRSGRGWPLFAVVGLAGTVASHFVGRARGRRRRGEKDARREDASPRESALAHKHLDGMRGIEIGGSAHNPFGLNTLNIDYTPSTETVYKQAELEICGESLRVDIAAQGDELPLFDESQDFVVSSHVLEHFPDPIRALREWHRVTRKGGYIFMIIPHRDRTPDRDRPRTTLAELIERNRTGEFAGDDPHCSVWITEDVVELIEHLGWELVEVQDVDDKVGNGFTIVVRRGGSVDARVGEVSGAAAAPGERGSGPGATLPTGAP